MLDIIAEDLLDELLRHLMYMMHFGGNGYLVVELGDSVLELGDLLDFTIAIVLVEFTVGIGVQLFFLSCG